MLNLSGFRQKTLSVCISTLVTSLYTGFTVGAVNTVYINTPTTLSGNHTDNQYEVSNTQLTLTPGTHLEMTDPSIDRLLEASGSANVVVGEGSVLTGGMVFTNASTLQMGIGGNNSVVQTGGVLLGDNSSGVFDNVNITGIGPVAGLDIQDNAEATLSARSHILSTGDPAASAAIVSSFGRLTANGSTIKGELAGITLFGHGTANLNNASTTGNVDGVFITANGKLAVSGGSVTSLQGGPSSAINRGKYGAGINIVASADDSDENIGVPGTPSVMVKDGAVISGKGSNSVGISSQAYGASTVDIAVSDSTVSGGKYGILVDYDNTINSATGNGAASPTTVKITHGVITGGEDALHVNAGGNANITVSGRSYLQGGNGVLLGSDAGSQAALTFDNGQADGIIINRGTTNVVLKNNSTWTGEGQNLTSVDVEQGSTWGMSGSSSVAGNLTNSGHLELGTAPGQAGHQLTVGGNYAGNNGTLQVNTVLGADNSLTDKLVVNGNTTGSTTVVVNNAGGTGAKTLDGIEVIEVKGNSLGDFHGDRIAAGAYDYTLARGSNTVTNKNFYLTSMLRNTTPFVAPVHVFRPEGAAYAANLSAANTLFNTALHDRLGETHYIDAITGQDAVTSLWLRQVGKHVGSHDGSGQLSTQSNSYVTQLGGDVAQWTRNGADRWHLGVSGGYANSRSNTQSSLTGYRARGNLDGYSVGMYATWLQDDASKTGAYVDSWANYNWFNNHVKGDKIADESYKSSGFVASLESGYTFALGEFGPATNPVGYYLTPQAQAVWMNVKADRHTETNGTVVTGEGNGNIQTRLGVRAFLKGRSQIDIAKKRTFEPFVEVNWVHNTSEFGSKMDGGTIYEAGTKNIGEVKLGVEAHLAASTQLWGNVGQQLGDKGYSATTAMVGLKYAF
jgi:autotransporter family porin